MASGDAVRLRAAVALLGSFPALAGASLDVDQGEVVLLQGANGAGKTTLLRVCAGLTGVVSGEVVVLGHDLVRDRRAVRRHVGLLHQGGGLYDDLTVADNVRFAVRAAHGDPDAVEPALGRLGLDGRLARSPVGRLSTGQRRRTALAILVARSPALWLLDEPHAGLDAEGRDLLDGLISEAIQVGATVLIASHELERVTALAHRTVVVAGGIVLDARPAEAPEPSSEAADTGVTAEPAADPGAAGVPAGPAAGGVAAADPVAASVAAAPVAAGSSDAAPAPDTALPADPSEPPVVHTDHVDVREAAHVA
jgi:heme ABC exporter ATP-binding subunit CcmA